MQQAVIIRLRPRGPWRYGPGEGGQDRVDTLYRSDRLYSAVTLAMRQLGSLEEWLDATARAESPAVVFGSLFPFQGDTLFVAPPATLWPPPLSLVTTPSPVFLTKVRWNAARFVPIGLVESILTGQRILADQWIPDAVSGCLLRRDRPSSSPYRMTTRSSAAVDRVTRSSVHSRTLACVEFESGSGLWTAARFAGEDAYSTWNDRVQAAFRLLADTGFGGRRTSGWGQTHQPEFQTGSWPALILPKLARAGTAAEETANGDEPISYWLLSLYSPASSDQVDWREGSYQSVLRGGMVESPSGESGAEKKRVRMIAEGSVLAAEKEPSGAAVNVAPEGFPHPVYRSGLALSLALPKAGAFAQPESAPEIVETPDQQEAAAPCEAPESGEPVREEMKEPEAAVREAPEEAASAEPAESAAEETPSVPEQTEEGQEPTYEI